MNTQSLFPLVDPATATDPVAQQTFREIEQELGFGMVPNIFRSMGSQPPLLAANWQKFKATILQGRLPRNIKEMIGVVVSTINRSEYAKQVHLHSLSVQGVEKLWLQQLANEELSDASLPDTIKAMVTFARQAARDPHALSSNEYVALSEAGLSPEEIRELVATIDLFQSVNSYTDLAHVPVDDL
jgi:uncharacterized peroxidase-related enzyme